MLSVGPRETKIRSLGDLPAEWWTLAQPDEVGYNSRTTGHIVGVPVELMLDKGASRNSTTEELVVGMVNHSLLRGMDGDHPEWPLV